MEWNSLERKMLTFVLVVERCRVVLFTLVTEELLPSDSDLCAGEATGWDPNFVAFLDDAVHDDQFFVRVRRRLRKMR